MSLPSSSKLYDVFFYEAFEEEARAIKKFMPPDINAGYTWKTIQESAHEKPAAKIISTRTQSHYPPEWVGLLNAVLSRSTGYDHLLKFKKQTGSAADLGYLPVYCNRSVAEQAMLLWMALLRKLPVQMENFSQFNRDGLTGMECEGKSLLVVGVGNIGSEVIKIGKGLGMQAKGVDIVKKFTDINYTEFDNAIKTADIIVAAMNLTPQNNGYFNYQKLKRAKKGFIFVNIARGELSPVPDLLKLIEQGHAGGVALDVFENEPDLANTLRSSDSNNNDLIKTVLELSRYPNVILTPHNAFNTSESVERKAKQSVQQIENYLKQKKFIWTIPE
jgi:D-lactate dehydrogenase